MPAPVLIQAGGVNCEPASALNFAGSTSAIAGDVNTITTTISGSSVAPVAPSNVVGGVPVLHIVPIPAGATGDVDLVLTNKTRIIDVWFVKTNAASGGNGTLTVKNGATAISDAMLINALADKSVVRALTIDDASHEIAAGGTLRTTRTRTTTTDETGLLYVLGIRVA